MQDLDLFKDFMDDEELQEQPTEQPSGLFGTLCKIVKNNGEKSVIYIKSGLLDQLAQLKTFLIDAELGIYQEDAPAYTFGFVEDKKIEVHEQYTIIEGIQPTQEEVKSAYLFNERFKAYVV